MAHMVAPDRPARRKMLFLTPTPPMVSANGLAMRAGLNLEALSDRYDLYLTIIPLLNAEAADRLDPRILRLCRAAAVVPIQDIDPAYERIIGIPDPIRRNAALGLYPKPLLCRFATSQMISRVAESHPDVAFDAAFVFRTYMADYAAGVTAQNLYLDMDDLESETRLRLAVAENESAGDLAASMERTEAQKYAYMEAAAVRRFDRILVASETDRVKLQSRYNIDNVAVIPNGFRVTAPLPFTKRDSRFRFLLCGTLGYLPNEDAALYFCSEVLPRIRSKIDTAIRVAIVGRNPSPRLMQLSTLPDVEIRADVPDMKEHYLESDAVVVPIRSGGGTRIKILEAFSFGRPVVSTSIGAEGLHVLPGKHLLVGEDPEQFAAQCLKLITNPDLGASLAQTAWTFVSENYNVRNVEKAFETAAII